MKNAIKSRIQPNILAHLLSVEWRIHGSGWSFRIVLGAMFAFGMLIAIAGNFPFPNVHKNSPFVVGYAIGFLSLVGILPMTLFAAQALLKEHDARFDGILSSTPLQRVDYLLSRFGAVFGLSSLTLFSAVAGLAVGHIIAAQMPSNAGEFGTFSVLSYLQPFMLFTLPNAFVCTTIICAIGWTLGWWKRSKLYIFLAGLLLYVLYFVGSIASNSPLMANNSPVSAEAMRLTALFDPFAMATFFEQTSTWAVYERNTRVLELSGTMLLNRLLWSGFALGLLALVMMRFRFEQKERRDFKREKFSKEKDFVRTPKPFFLEKRLPKSILQHPKTTHHSWATFWSFIRLDVFSTLKSIPFLLLVLLWTFFIGVELVSAVQGGVRFPARYATTTLMVNEILTTLPPFALLAVLFFSNEILWRSHSVRITPLEDSTPLPSSAVFCAKLIAPALLPFVLVVQSILVGILFQIVFGYPHIHWGAYASLLYVLALPLALSAVLAVSLQTLTQSRYTGLVLAIGVFLLTSTPLGRMLGIRHPLLRFAAPLSTKMTDMSGFDTTTIAFSWQMLYWTAITLAIGLVCSILWKRTVPLWKSVKMAGSERRRFSYLLALGLCVLAAAGSGGYIFYQMHIAHPYRSAEYRNSWAEHYERRYRRFQHKPQPTITDVQTTIHLYPQQERYTVKGRYTMVNHQNVPIDTVLISLDKASMLDSLSIPNARCIMQDAEYGQYIYTLKTPLDPDDSLMVIFQFHSSWSAFASNLPFNSIIQNGAFMRISRYYPVLGYQAGNELTDEQERKNRRLPAVTPLQTLEEYGINPQKAQTNDFINLDATISTDADQIALGVGELQRTWMEAAPEQPSQQRRYFHYRTPSPIPFRFAVSSARYSVAKDTYKGSIEAGSRNVDIEIYYHPDHTENVSALIHNAKETLAYCEKNFGRYPYNVLRFAESTGFASGFAATSYPATIFVNENQAFHADMRNGGLPDVINELAGHEVSHQWWGGQLAPEDVEGEPMLTETFAMYTELMLYEKMHGREAALTMVKMHRDFYVSGRGFQTERPLYRSTSDLAFVNYDKGLVVMHQLRHLLGEERVNALLRAMLQQHGFPKSPPTTLDFLRVVYAECPPTQHGRIDQLFKQVVVHDAKISSAEVLKKSDGTYNVRIIGSLQSFSQNSKGEQVEVFSNHEVEIAVDDTDGNSSIYRIAVVNGRIDTVMHLKSPPTLLTLDPHYLLLDINSSNNEYSSFSVRM